MVNKKFILLTLLWSLFFYSSSAYSCFLKMQPDSLTESHLLQKATNLKSTLNLSIEIPDSLLVELIKIANTLILYDLYKTDSLFKSFHSWVSSDSISKIITTQLELQLSVGGGLSTSKYKITWGGWIFDLPRSYYFLTDTVSDENQIINGLIIDYLHSESH